MSGSIGLVRKSHAPSSVARNASSCSPWPVSTIDGHAGKARDHLEPDLRDPCAAASPGRAARARAAGARTPRAPVAVAREVTAWPRSRRNEPPRRWKAGSSSTSSTRPVRGCRSWCGREGEGEAGAPSRGARSARRAPPCAAMMRATMARPRPVPPGLRDTKGWNRRVADFRGHAGAVVADMQQLRAAGLGSTCRGPLAHRRVRRATRAFSNRLVDACSTRRGSASRPAVRRPARGPARRRRRRGAARRTWAARSKRLAASFQGLA